MGRWTSYFLLLLWICYLFVCGVILFTRGFLLTRQSLPNISTCNDHSFCQNIGLNEDLYKKPENLHCLDRNQIRLLSPLEMKFTCRKTNRKVIILMVDALRYDFVLYNKSVTVENRLAYQNQMPIFQELLETVPNNARLFKFLAHPPTTTMQRLKGLTTGSLPTFIDASSNFGTSEIEEDNILSQVKSQGKNIILMGDDVWTSLFPNMSVREFTFPSFNMFDLDTVDNAVISLFKREIYEKDWHLLIAHMLGVDHCGHAYGPLHSEMSRKLQQVNAFVKDVVKSMDDDSILLVMGDHGMTVTGDHGGESQDELTSALFVYSSKPFLPMEITDVQTFVYQVDIVPTISYMMGSAIPFSNLGKVILEILPAPADYGDTSDLVMYATEALVANIEQIMVYINTYSRYTHLFSKEKIATIANRFHHLRDELEHVRDLPSFLVYKTKSLRFLNFIRTLFEEIWVQFDSFLMSRGLVLTFLLLTFLFVVIEGVPRDKVEEALDGGFLGWSYTVVGLCWIGSFVLQYFQLIEDWFLLSCVSSLTLSVFLLAVMVVNNWECVPVLGLRIHQSRRWSDVFPRAIFLCSLFLFFSNSFVVEEAQALYFLTATSVCYIVFSHGAIKEQPTSVKGRRDDKSTFEKLLADARVRTFIVALVFCLLIRLSTNFWRCREEQRWCVDVPLKMATNSVRIVWTLAAVGLMVSSVRMWLRASGNLVGFSAGVTMARYGPTVMAVCTGGYWVLQGLPRDARSRLLVPWQQQLLPWTVYALIALGIVIVYVQSLFIYVVQKKADCLSVYGRENIIPQLFHQVKEVISEAKLGKKGPSEMPVVYGLATVYSCVFIMVAQYLVLLIILVLGDTVAPTAVLLFASIVCFLILTAYSRLEAALTIEQLFNVPWSIVMAWGLMSSYYFYGTGHQAAISSINWYAAFVGTGGQFNNHIVPAILIGINTFCSELLCGVLLPLLLVAPFTLFIMMPKGLTFSSDREGFKKAMWSELAQGELALFERESLLRYAAFKLASKYILFCAARVTASMLAAMFHCRHLMVWKIFSPRFIFEGLGFIVTLVSTLFGFMLLGRITHKIDGALSALIK